MTGLSLILVGAIALSNAGLLFYLLSERNRKLKSPASSEQEADEPTEEDPTAAQTDQLRPRVGKSKTVIGEDIERYIRQKIEEKVEEKVQLLRDELIGDVKTEDVEFDNSSEDIEASAPEKEDFVPHARMTKEAEDRAFEDVRINDVEEDSISAPAASGTTFDEIEEALQTAENPDATPEEKAKAGDVFDKLMDTNFMNIFETDEEIKKGIKACISEMENPGSVDPVSQDNFDPWKLFNSDPRKFWPTGSFLFWIIWLCRI